MHALLWKGPVRYGTEKWIPYCTEPDQTETSRSTFVATYVETSGMAPLITSLLVALDNYKCPGIHPIGVSEILRWLIGNSSYLILEIARDVILDTVGSLQC